jgi:1-acyl-sn-glycerol-3-phosphate acyltransferase
MEAHHLYFNCRKKSAAMPPESSEPSSPQPPAAMPPESSDPSSPQPSRWDLLKGFMSFNICYTSATALTFGLPLLLIHYPKSFGLLVTLPYWTYTLSFGRHEIRDGRHWPAFSKSFILFRAMRRHLGIHIHPLPSALKQAEEQPNARFVFAMFPHAVWSDYHVAMDGLWQSIFPNIYQNIRTLTASVLFRVPVIRELGLWTSGIDASRKIAEKALDRGRTILVRPGGEAEQLRTNQGREIVYLKNRKGFIRLAMRNNVPVVPCYVFGASDYHYTWHGFFKPREWLQKKFGVCVPLALGYCFSLCPFPVKTTVVFGEPLLLETKETGNPSPSEVDRGHAKFCQELEKLFEKHKHDLGYRDRKLEIV